MTQEQQNAFLNPDRNAPTPAVQFGTGTPTAPLPGAQADNTAKAPAPTPRAAIGTVPAEWADPKTAAAAVMDYLNQYGPAAAVALRLWLHTQGM